MKHPGQPAQASTIGTNGESDPFEDHLPDMVRLLIAKTESMAERTSHDLSLIIAEQASQKVRIEAIYNLLATRLPDAETLGSGGGGI